jgi:5,10-methylenetetrahydromethanopterin reductase
MAKVREFGVGIESLDAPGFVAQARLAEELGFKTFWVPEDLYRGAFTLASAIAMGTKSMRIGLGILNPYVRHPATIAMELGALEEISGGRSILGIGAGLKSWIEGQLHIPYRKPTVAMREAIEIVRALIAGGDVNYSGQVFQVSNLNLRFRPPRNAVPAYLGVMGPKNLEMAGEIGDGILLSAMSSPAYVRYALDHVRRGAARVGRSLNGFDVAALLFISIADDERAARTAVKPFMAMLLSFMAGQPDHPIISTAGVSVAQVLQIAEAAAKGQDATALISEEMVDAFAIAGSPERCREGLARIVEAGVTSPVAFEIAGVDPEVTIRAVHTHLMPHFL